MSAAADLLRLVRFSHSIFALPFALMAAWLAADGVPPLERLALILVCAVAARTSAMAFNRWVDRGLDARNPRTATRELPRGAVTPRAALALAALSGGVFVGAAFALGAWCGWLSLPVLALLLGYSVAKRFTWACHLWLGVCLALAPLGAWTAVLGSPSGDLAVPLLLAAAVVTWVAGFDLVYASQDAAFDRAAGLHSLPARFGVARALSVSAWLHVATVVCLAAFGARAGLGLGYWCALAGASALLVWQHRIVRPGDLSRADAAFFTANGWVGVALLAGLLVDVSLR